jgi:hypothetical protein
MPAASIQKHRGRPFKYLQFIALLHDQEIYTPAKIVREGLNHGLLHELDEVQVRKTRQRIRHTLARFAKNHSFPTKGDGTVALPGQYLVVGWRGGRWKQAMLVFPSTKP